MTTMSIAWRVLAFLVVFGYLMHALPQTVVTVLFCGVLWWSVRAWQTVEARRECRRLEDEATAWRCDVEDQMYVSGDAERGVFGRWNGVNI